MARTKSIKREQIKSEITALELGGSITYSQYTVGFEVIRTIVTEIRKEHPGHRYITRTKGDNITVFRRKLGMLTREAKALEIGETLTVDKSPRDVRTILKTVEGEFEVTALSEIRRLK